MSIFYQTIALWICGVCPDCRHTDVDCERHIKETHFGDEEGHQYECRNCGASEWVEDFQVSLAYDNTTHWDRFPGTKP